MRVCTQPCPKWPYRLGSASSRSRTPRRAARGRGGSRRAGRAGRRSPPSPPRCRDDRARARSLRGHPRARATARLLARAPRGSATVGIVPGLPERVQHRSRLRRPRRVSSRRTATIRNACPPAASSSAIGLRRLICSSWMRRVVHALERDRFVGQDRRDRVGGTRDVREAEHDEGPLLSTGSSSSSAWSTVTKRRLAADRSPATSKRCSGSSESRL